MALTRRLVPCIGAAVFLLVASSSADAQTANTAARALNAAGSAVGFTLSAKALFTVKRNGQFKDFDGDVSYDPENPGNTRVELTVYTDSVDMHNSGHDQLLKSEDFFDVERFPTMHFSSSSAVISPEGSGLLTGDMTIRGITKQLTIPVRVRSDAAVGSAVLETNFQIDRTEFGLNGKARAGGFNVSIGKNVEIHIAMAVGGKPQ